MDRFLVGLLILSAISAGGVLGIPDALHAAPNSSSPLDDSMSYQVFTKNRFSIQTMGGGLFSPFLINTSSPDIDYAMLNVRMCWMMNSPGLEKVIYTGNLELIFEITGAGIYKGPGDYMAGATLLFRYNFVDPYSRLVPYIQGGAGIVINDIYKDKGQDLVGQSVEFTPQFSAGLRYLLSRNWSADIEAMYHHVSNAGLDARNEGINAIGGFVGLTYYFDALIEK